MKTENFIKGNNEDEVWQQINAQFLLNPDTLGYTAIIDQANQRIILDIDIDLGGGFESGYETTSMTASLQHATDFRFAIHKEYFIDEIGKFFGMQDVEIGYPEFDKRLIIKTNEEAKVKAVFSKEAVREVFQSLENFTFGVTSPHSSDHPAKESILELIIEEGITDVNQLRLLYTAFFSVLTMIN